MLFCTQPAWHVKLRAITFASCCTLYYVLYDHWSWSLLCSMHHPFAEHSAYSNNWKIFLDAQKCVFHCLSIWYLVSGKILPQLIIQMFKSLLFSTWKYTLWSALGTVVCTSFALGTVPLRLSNPPSTAAYETGTPPATELSSTQSSSSSYHIKSIDSHVVHSN